jgi:hypothetical protein
MSWLDVGVFGVAGRLAGAIAYRGEQRRADVRVRPQQRRLWFDVLDAATRGSSTDEVLAIVDPDERSFF